MIECHTYGTFKYQLLIECLQIQYLIILCCQPNIVTYLYYWEWMDRLIWLRIWNISNNKMKWIIEWVIMWCSIESIHNIDCHLYISNIFSGWLYPCGAFACHYWLSIELIINQNGYMNGDEHITWYGYIHIVSITQSNHSIDTITMNVHCICHSNE